jgi:hypothetical protein
MYRIIILLFLITSLSKAQTIEFTGNVQGDDDLDQIHVVNVTSKTYSITNVSGDFKIEGKLNDTIVFSSILYQKKEIVVTPTDVKNKHISIKMFPFVNQLDEVVIGRILTGDMMSDVKNMGNKKQITFADVGIPGYTGKPLTQSERRLKEASSFKPTVGGGISGGGIGLQLNPLINAITGRTKELKNRVDIENRQNVLTKVKLKFGNTFFEAHPLDKTRQDEFYFFCAEHKSFKELCSGSDLKTLQFLSNQYKIFLERIKAK